MENALTELFGVVLEAQRQFCVPVQSIDAHGKWMDPLVQVLEFISKELIEGSVDFGSWGVWGEETSLF